MPFSTHEPISWISSGAATMYGTFFDDKIDLDMSICRPPSIVPDGPPTSGNPMVLITESIRTLPEPPPSPAIPMSAMAAPNGSLVRSSASSVSLVSWSRTIVWASTPLMKMGTGMTPSFSRHDIRSMMYGCPVITCFLYSNTAALGHSVHLDARGPSRSYHRT